MTEDELIYNLIKSADKVLEETKCINKFNTQLQNALKKLEENIKKIKGGV